MSANVDSILEKARMLTPGEKAELAAREKLARPAQRRGAKSVLKTSSQSLLTRSSSPCNPDCY